MRRVVLLQSPSKLVDVVPIFYRESKRLGLFDHYYVITNYQDDLELGDDVTLIRKDKDEQFASNILDLIKHVPEDIFCFCCEDCIVCPDVNTDEVHKAFDFVSETPNAGFLRMSYHKKIEMNHTGGMYAPMKRKYKYYISLQPSIWRKQYMKHCLKRGEDAWTAEIQGAQRARNHSTLVSYGCTKPVYWFNNFYKSGKYIRNSYAKYIAEHGLDADGGKKVYVVDKHQNKKFVKLRNWKDERGNT